MILHNSLLRKLLWIVLLPVAAALLLLNFYFPVIRAQNQVAALERQLAAEAGILLGELPAVPGSVGGLGCRGRCQSAPPRNADRAGRV